MQVLFISVRADIGGGPEHLYRLIEQLGSRVEAHVACPNEAPYWQKIGALQNTRQMIEIPHRAFHVSALRQLAREIRTQDIALIHTHGKGAGLYGRLLAMMTGRPCVHTFHGLHIGEYDALRKTLYLTLERGLGLWTKAAINVSQSEREAVRATGILPDRKLSVVPNGVIVPDTPAKRHIPDGEAPLKIVAVSRFDYQKNSELLLPIAEQLKARGISAQIRVLGTGEGAEALQSAIDAQGLSDTIELAGPSSDPRAHFRDSDLFLSTSRWEGMPLAVLEAMSEGLPVVATDVPGNRDLVDATVGGVYPDDNAEAAAALIAELTADGLRQKGQAAHNRVLQQYSVQRMADATMAIYTNALSH